MTKVFAQRCATLRTIQRELGEGDGEEEEIGELEEAIQKAGMPKDIKKGIEGVEATRCLSMNNQGGYIRTWLELLIGCRTSEVKELFHFLKQKKY